ncbi:MAG TPA: formyltransferase family protein [Polyangiaceae bacterium]|nr:formyltransferase family protein [Polyangiaceae bacterium]
MKIAYFGLPLAGLLLLQDGHQLCRAVLSPVAGPGRRRLLARLGAHRVSAGEAVSSLEIEEQLRQAQPDLIVSWYYTRLIEGSWLALAPLGGIGAHPSLLPRHRGPNPFFWSIDQGDRETGVTIHRLSDAYDTGAMLAQRRLSLDDRDAWQLARALDRPSLQLLRDTVRQLSRGESLPEIQQDETQATWAAEPSEDLLGVDWSWSTERILRRIRALSPVPGLALEISGVRFFVTRARPATLRPAALDPGEAVLVRRAGELEPVLCTCDGSIAIEQASWGINEPDLDLEEGESCSGPELARVLLRARPHMLDSVLEHTQ